MFDYQEPILCQFKRGNQDSTDQPVHQHMALHNPRKIHTEIIAPMRFGAGIEKTGLLNAAKVMSSWQVGLPMASVPAQLDIWIFWRHPPCSRPLSHGEGAVCRRDRDRHLD